MREIHVDRQTDNSHSAAHTNTHTKTKVLKMLHTLQTEFDRVLFTHIKIKKNIYRLYEINRIKP